MWSPIYEPCLHEEDSLSSHTSRRRIKWPEEHRQQQDLEEGEEDESTDSGSGFGGRNLKQQASFSGTHRDCEDDKSRYASGGK